MCVYNINRLQCVGAGSPVRAAVTDIWRIRAVVYSESNVLKWHVPDVFQFHWSFSSFSYLKGQMLCNMAATQRTPEICLGSWNTSLTLAFDAPWDPPSPSLGLVHWKGNAVPVISSVGKRDLAIAPFCELKIIFYTSCLFFCNAWLFIYYLWHFCNLFLTGNTFTLDSTLQQCWLQVSEIVYLSLISLVNLVDIFSF